MAGYRVLLHGFETADIPEADHCVQLLDGTLVLSHGRDVLRRFAFHEWIDYAPLDDDGEWPERGVEELLQQLCVEFGFCLPQEARQAIKSAPPDTAEAFLTAVVAAEGLNPDTMARSLRNQMLARIRDRCPRRWMRASR